MEERQTRRWIHTQQLQDIPELIHRIQLLLPLKEATRTCVLSKSWLHAWSTIPTLKFHPRQHTDTKIISEEQDRKYIKLIDSTLQRYLRDNIPIEIFDLDLDIKNKELASLTEKVFWAIGSKHLYLKELFLTIFVRIDSFTLPGELFSNENLTSLSVNLVAGRMINSAWMKSNPVMIISSNSVINCVSLQVLELVNVHISEEVLNNLLTICSLLKKIDLIFCEGLKTIKVKNLQYLSGLVVKSRERVDTLEIDDVPRLRFFVCNSLCVKPLAFNMDSLGSVTELLLGGVSIDDALLDMINLKLPLLVTLNLTMERWSSKSLNITSASLERLILHLREIKKIDIQVYAPKLLYFSYDGVTMNRLSFPAINACEQIKLILRFKNLFHNSFFLKMREALNSSSKFDVEIIDVSRDIEVPFKTDIDELRRRVLFPATNVRQLSFKSFSRKGFWEDSSFLDALFIICHPNYVKASLGSFKDIIYFYKLMVTRMQEKKSLELKDVEIKNHGTRQWETLSNSWKSFLDESSDSHSVEFKLNWSS